MKPKRLVIVGGVAGGASAAARDLCHRPPEPRDRPRRHIALLLIASGFGVIPPSVAVVLHEGSTMSSY